VLWLAGCAALAASGCESTSSSNGNTPTSDPVPQIKTLSNRADMISGGDALVEIVLPDGAQPDALHVTLGGKDISASFAKRANGRVIGLVDGMAEGANILSADLGSGHGAYQMITNHKIGGPIFSGPQVTPFACATPTGSAPTADAQATAPSGLMGTATDAQCNIATEYKLFYRTTAHCDPAVNPDPIPGPVMPDQMGLGPCFLPYDPATPPPTGEVMATKTNAGVALPFIVRIERGTLNRGIYDIAVLFDVSKYDPKVGWKPTEPAASWNGKAVYAFGVSSGQPRMQFHSETSWADVVLGANAQALGEGFLVAVNSMTDSLYNSNRVLMTETVMMMKEKIIDTYGEARYMMGAGCSGGSINQMTTASIFPGLLDGIQPTCTYPDSETTAIEVADCALLVNYYTTQTWADFVTGLSTLQIVQKKAAINGHLDQLGCHSWVNNFANLGRPGNYIPQKVLDDAGRMGPDPDVKSPINNCALPNNLVYDPATNPTGIRCTGQDYAAAVFGTTTQRLPGIKIDITRAVSTTDNVGVQYGLKALLGGAISAEEFVTLNERIGGVDFDDNFTATAKGTPPFSRSQADPDALAVAYRAGIVGDGHRWAKLPIIDLRGWDDEGIHHVWRSFALRARLDAANGNHSNHVMWRYTDALAAATSPDAETSKLPVTSLELMDRWLTSMKADASAMALEAKVVANKPGGAFDFCNKPLSPTDLGHSMQVTDMAVCDTDQLLVKHSSPRQVAGGQLTEDVLKCQLRQINRVDYNPATPPLTDAQFARLQAVFPDGVCDFTKPGVGQQGAIGPLDFSAGPGGVPFPDPPLNKAF
jgi:hypothetical protein